MNDSPAIGKRAAADQKMKIEHGPDGIILVTARPLPSAQYRSVRQMLDHWASATPERTILAERDGGGRWHAVTYRDAHAAVSGIVSALSDRNLSVDRPILMVGRSDSGQALLALGALCAGIPYAIVGADFVSEPESEEKLRKLINLLQPGLIHFDADPRLADAVDRVAPASVEFSGVFGKFAGRAVSRLEDLILREPSPIAAAASCAVGLDTAARVHIELDSNGEAGGIVTTHRMIWSNQAVLADIFPGVSLTAPAVFASPNWSDALGAILSLDFALYTGGTLYLNLSPEAEDARGDAEWMGAPPGAEPSVFVVRSNRFDGLLDLLERDPVRATRWLGRVRNIVHDGGCVAGANLARLARLVGDAKSSELSVVSIDTAADLGLWAYSVAQVGEKAVDQSLDPVPGSNMKLVPTSDGHAARFKGDAITPGFWKARRRTSESFDEAGFYKSTQVLQLG